MSASSARRGAAHRDSTSCSASGSVSISTRQMVESDGATQRPAAGSRHAPSARSSSWSRFLANRSVAAGPCCPPRAEPARRSPAPSRGGACGPARGARPAPGRTGRAASAARRACSAPAPTGTTTPDGPPGPPAAARPGAAPARTSPSGAPCGSVYDPLCRAKPFVRPTRVQFDAAQHVPRNRAGSTNVSASSTGWPCAASQSARSRRRLRDSDRDARFGMPDASGSTRNRVLFAIRCSRRNCTDRCQPSQRSRGAHLERPRLPAQQRQPVPPPLRNVAQSPTRELPEAQVVALVHQRVPAPPLVPADRPHLNLPNHHRRLVEFRLHAPRCTPNHAEKPVPPDQALKSPPSG